MLFLVAVLPVVLIGVAGCGQPAGKAAPRTAAKSALQHPEKTTENMLLKGAKVIWPDAKGRPLMVAKFPKANAKLDSRSAAARIKDVTADLYKDGKVSSTLTAPWVELDNQKKEVRAYGGVRIVSKENGTVAVGPQMIWKPKENKIFGSGGDTVTRKNMSVTADSFVSDIGLGDVKFHGNARAVLESK